PGDEDLVAPGARQGIAFPPHDAVELFAAPRAEDEAAFREGVLRQSGDVEAGPAVRRVEFVAFAEPGTSPLEVVPLFLEVLNAVVGRNDPADVFPDLCGAVVMDQVRPVGMDPLGDLHGN